MIIQRQKEYTSKRTKKLRDRLFLEDRNSPLYQQKSKWKARDRYISGEVSGLETKRYPLVLVRNESGTDTDRYWIEARENKKLAKKILSKGNHALTNDELKEINNHEWLQIRKRAERLLRDPENEGDYTFDELNIADLLNERRKFNYKDSLPEDNLNVRISEGLAGANNMEISREEKSRLLEKANERKARLEKIDKDKKLKKGLVIGLGSAAVVSGLTAGGIALHKHLKKKKAEKNKDKTAKQKEYSEDRIPGKVYYDSDGTPMLSTDKTAGHFRRNQGKYLVGGGAALGAGIGYATSKKSAEKKAKEKGLEPGTEEYKKFIKKHRLKHAALGAGVGAVGGVGASFGKHMYDVNHHSNKFTKLQDGDIVKFTWGKKAGGQHYGVYDAKTKDIVEVCGDKIENSKFEDILDYDEIVNYVDQKGNPVENKYRYKVEHPEKPISHEELTKRIEKVRKSHTGDGVYDWLDNNCEHFAREVANGRRESLQGESIPGRLTKLYEKITKKRK